MKVSELIKELEAYPGDMDVFLDSDERAVEYFFVTVYEGSVHLSE